MQLIKNKKAGEKWLSIWWFFVLVVIGVAIVMGVLIYFNADVNIKEFEADILAERIVRCLTEGGYLRQDFIKNKEFDIFKECNLKREVFGKESDFYFNISIKDREGKFLREDIMGGTASFEKDCGIEKTMTAKYYPRCSKKNELALYLNTEENTGKLRLKIITASNQEIKKVTVI